MVTLGSTTSTTLSVKILEKQGYAQSRFTPGLWKQKWRPIAFSLVFNNFGVKYSGKKHTNNLIEALKDNYKILEDWEGSK